jgi:nicotinamidase-related amidase
MLQARFITSSRQTTASHAARSGQLAANGQCHSSLYRHAEHICTGRSLANALAATRASRGGRVAGRFPDRTVFTRFITPQRPEDMPGTWQRYYTKWREATRQCIDPDLLQLLPSLRRFAPPATVINKSRYSAFAEPALLRYLQERGADSLIVTGSETDVCVLATVMGAIDLGYPVVLVHDAVCSSSDAGHDCMLALYGGRYREQIATASAEEILDRWKRA